MNTQAPLTDSPALPALSNAEIADRLASLAQLLSTQKENPYKVKAYRRAASSIRTLSESIDELVREEADLTRFEGIGEAISSAIREIVLTGSLGKLDKLRSEASPALASISADPRRVLRILQEARYLFRGGTARADGKRRHRKSAWPAYGAACSPGPGVKLLFITMHVNPAYLEAALNAGGTGYVLKSAAREELLDAIKIVLNGRIYVTPSLSSEHLERFEDAFGILGAVVGNPAAKSTT